MTRITSAFAAALIASASFAGAALANEGEYYEGVRPNQNSQSIEQGQSGSYGYTGSVSRADRQIIDTVPVAKGQPGSGSYYEGVNRPN